MALFKKCDRCSIPYEPYPNASCKSRTYVRNGLKRIQIDSRGDIARFDTTNIDLCPKCMEEFEKWLDSKKGDKNAEN